MGRLVVEALKRLPGTPTREGLLDAIYQAPFDLGGVTLADWADQEPRLRSRSSSRSCGPMERSHRSSRLPKVTAR